MLAEHTIGAANVVMGAAPAAHVEPLDGVARAGSVVMVQQHEVLLGTHGQILHVTLYLLATYTHAVYY